MGHQPFEMWLLSEDPLDLNQATALQAHLDTCVSCRMLAADWVEVRNLFTHARQVGPAPGFTTRWQERFDAQGSHSQHVFEQEMSILFFGVTAGIALLSLFAIIVAGVTLFDSPAQVLLPGLYWLGNMINTLNAVENILIVIAQVLPGVVPAAGWIGFVVLATLLCLIWAYVLQKMFARRRIAT